jgi:hypothetical protein
VEELADLAPAISKALAAASPADDVLLLSTSRRETGFLSVPLSVTARLFMQDSALNVVINDVRLDALSAWRAARVLPTLRFGSRTTASAAALRGKAAAPRRTDWLAIDVTAVDAVSTRAAATPSPPRATGDENKLADRPRDAGYFDAQAQRLKGLLGLREQGLISEDEYQRKRGEILQAL